MRNEGKRRLRVERGKIVEDPPRERQLTGKISHWGRVGKRTHVLTAKVPDDFTLGETFLVRVLTVPNCSEDDGCKPKKEKA